MANQVPAADVASICAHIEATPGLERLRALASQVDAGPEIVAAILEEASKFNEVWLGPLGSRLDRFGCRLEEGRVRTASGHREAWRAYLEAGWLGIDQPTPAASI